MKINEFIEMYKKNRMVNISDVLEVQEYVSTPMKKRMCELVIDSCMEEADGILQYNSFDRYTLFTIAVISLHTNLEFSVEEDGSTSIEEFDELNSLGLVEKIISTFQKDYDTCQIILDMLTSDKIKNQETLEKKILKLINNVFNEIDFLNNIENKEDVLALLESVIEK